MLALSLPLAIAGPAVIENVTVSVKSNEAPPPPRAAKRMEASISVIGQNVLIGKKVDELNDKRSAYENLVKEVFDRVLVGYSVQSVRINSGTTTAIDVTIAPWGDVVKDVALEINFVGLSPEVAAMARKDLGDIEDAVNNVLVGLPVDAVEWAGGVSKSVIREMLAQELPEFYAAFDIIPGPRTVVKLSLTPLGPTVQDVKVSLKSQTVPNLLLLSARPTVEEAGKVMQGLPVAFVERHRDYFTAKVNVAAASRPAAKRYGLTIMPVINAGTETNVTVTANTTKYKFTLEGYLDVGRDSNDNTSARLHAGKFVGQRDEAFVEVDFMPNSVTWQFLPGWGHQITPDTIAGMKYNLNEKQNVLWINHRLTSDWSLRLEHIPEISQNEVAIRYKLHDFLSAEYVMGDEDHWIRLVGNL